MLTGGRDGPLAAGTQKERHDLCCVFLFGTWQHDTFLPQVDRKPVLVQNEIHPYYQDTPVVERIRENISIFDFSLSEDEMGKIAALNRNEKHDWYCVY